MRTNSGITNEEIEQKWAELNADDGDIRIMAMLHELLERRKSKDKAIEMLTRIHGSREALLYFPGFNDEIGKFLKELE